MTLSKMPPIGVNFVAAAFLVSIASAAAAGAAEVAQKREAARPNIVLIMADDFGYECVTCNGGQSYQTPRLDAMAAGGMRFTECRSQPVCTPTRVQIMTGRCNSRNYWAFGSLHPKELTFGHILGAAGYATCITGKWHVGGAEHSSEAIVGFDEYCLWEGQKELDELPGRPKHEGAWEDDSTTSRYWHPCIVRNHEVVPTKPEDFSPAVFTDFLCNFMEHSEAYGRNQNTRRWMFLEKNPFEARCLGI